VIPYGMFSICTSLFSLELPENVTEIGNFSFEDCYCLRNVAFPPDATIDYAFVVYDGIDDHPDRLSRMSRALPTPTDLSRLFGYEANIINELKHRFDGLPVHSVVYYQSYNQGVLQNLIMLNPTGTQQDCLGMTPLHILACSSVHDIKLYRVIIKNYPTNLITEDRWGAIPLLYAFWGAAPVDCHFVPL
jgi:hypothetical protein